MDQDRAFKLARDFLAHLQKEKKTVKQAYMFGSHVKGTQHEESDIDIAIVLSKLKNGFDMQVELMKIGRHFDSRIEPHPFAEADFDTSNPFAREIIETGIRVL